MKKPMLILILIFGLVALFIGYLAFTWRSDVSRDERFSKYIGRPITVKDSSTLTLVKEETQYRFKKYRLDAHQSSIYDSPEIKTVKTYKPGDVVYFHQAMSYYSLFVGTTYYLIGRDTLDSGEVVEFEYYASFDHQPAIWETLDEFVLRRDKEREESYK
jgi:hypothetical protein